MAIPLHVHLARPRYLVLDEFDEGILVIFEDPASYGHDFQLAMQLAREQASADDTRVFDYVDDEGYTEEVVDQPPPAHYRVTWLAWQYIPLEDLLKEIEPSVTPA